MALIPLTLREHDDVFKNGATSSATGCGTAMTTVGAICVNGSESSTLVKANLPPYTPAGTVASTSSVSDIFQTISVVSTGGGSGAAVAVGNQSGAIIGAITSNGSLVGTAQGGTSTALPNVMPAIGLTYLLRVL
jgi:hypothetical protein